MKRRSDLIVRILLLSYSREIGVPMCNVSKVCHMKKGIEKKKKIFSALS